MLKPFKSIPGFYNRTLETEKLINVLLQKPKFNVITGGNDTGKTALINYVTNIFFEATGKQINVIELNFRQSPCFSSQNLFDAFRSVIKPRFFDEIMNYSLKSMNINNFKIEWEKIEKIEDPLKGFENTLKLIEDSVPSFSEENKLVNVLYIDEANKLTNLSDSNDKNDVKAYQFLMDWIIRNTKEKPKLNVVFGTTDSFFLHNLMNSLSENLMDTMTIGDLSKKDSLSFYNYLIDTNSYFRARKEILKNLNFLEDVYPFVGGRMYYIEKAITDYILDPSRPKGEQITLYRGRFNYCRLALKASKNFKDPQFQYQPNWSRETALKAFNEISNVGYIKYDDIAANKSTLTEYMSLVQNNILNYRHAAPAEEDVDGLNKSEYPVLIAPSQMIRRSMKELSKI